MNNAALSKYLPILQALYTKDQAIAFQNQLNLLLSSIFLSEVSPGKKIEELFTVEIKDGVLTSLRNEGIALTDPMQIKNFLVPLIDELNTIPLIKLQLAFEPTAQTLKKISSWFLESLNKKYLVDIEIHKEIVGGIVIIANGLTADFSLRKKIRQMHSQAAFIGLLDNGQHN